MQTSAEREGLQSSARGGGRENRARAGSDTNAARADEFADLSAYPFKKRLLIRAADLAFYAFIKLAGRTVRFEVEGREHLIEAERAGPPIYVCWHERVFLSTYFWRGRGIVVMTSRSTDGEYIARFIQRFGYGAARGSSSRGGAGALIEMIRLVRGGRPAGFMIDGPRGPRRVAKTGALLLAKKTGRPVLPFAVEPERRRTLSSWDHMQIPKLFTRALVSVAAPVWVPADADDATLEAKRDELQRALEDLDRRGQEWRENTSRGRGDT